MECPTIQQELKNNIAVRFFFLGFVLYCFVLIKFPNHYLKFKKGKIIPVIFGRIMRHLIDMVHAIYQALNWEVCIYSTET